MCTKPDRQQIKLILIDWLKAAASLLDDILYVVIFIVLLRIFDIEISLPMAILLGLLLLIFIFFVNKFIISSFRIRQVTGAEGMIGKIGTAVQPLAPAGTVFICGEHWKAKTVDKDIQADEEVEVVGLEGLVLLVKRKERESI